MRNVIQSVRQISPWLWGCVMVAVLTVALGWLQSHWVGELSERERESQQRHLTADALRFGADFDRELTQLYTALQTGPVALGSLDGGALATRYTLWMARAAYPRLVRSLWIAEPGEASVTSGRSAAWRFFRLDSQQNLVLATPPATWTDPQDAGAMLNPLNEEMLALFIPIISATGATPPALASNRGATAYLGTPVTIRFLIVQLDLQCITNELLPALTRLYFRGPGGSEPEYRVVVVRREMPHRVIYDSSWGSHSPVPTSADVTAPLFSLKRDLAVDVHAAAGTPTRPQLSTGGTISFATAAAWELRVTHRSGSLEVLAARMRWQNLVLSLTLLVVLAGAVIFLVVTVRRKSALALRQTQFVAGVSHELRTPMAVIGMIAANLADGLVSRPEQVRRYGSILQEESRRLATTVEQVISYARIGTRNLPPREPIQVNELVRNVLEPLQFQIAALDFICTLRLEESLPAVIIDRFSMECVLQNLLTNALKYSAERREIVVSTGREESGAGPRVWIEVEDQGIGIEPDERAAIFEPFHRGRAAIERKLPGSGLGLSLVERIVQAHGGTVRLRSEPGQGSAFTVSLPAAAGHT